VDRIEEAKKLLEEGLPKRPDSLDFALESGASPFPGPRNIPRSKSVDPFLSQADEQSQVYDLLGTVRIFIKAIRQRPFIILKSTCPISGRISRS